MCVCEGGRDREGARDENKKAKCIALLVSRGTSGTSSVAHTHQEYTKRTINMEIYVVAVVKVHTAAKTTIAICR